MTKVIAIIGNGPSRSIFDDIISDRHELGRDMFDLIVGCNYPEHDVDVSVFADSFSARLMRLGAKHQDRFGEFDVVLGERAHAGLAGVKMVPGSVDTLQKEFDDVVTRDIVKYPDVFRQDQRYLSSGHIAFLWACQTCENPEIHMFGFDSLFTGDHLSTYSNRDVREWEKPWIERKVLDTPRPSATIWRENWNLLFGMCKFASVRFYGYNGDPDPGFIGNVKAEFVRRKDCEVF